MQLKYALLVIVGSLICCGCSNKEVYTAIQKNRQLECQKVPPAQYQQCMHDYDQSYEAYKAERNDLLHGKRD